MPTDSPPSIEFDINDVYGLSGSESSYASNGVTFVLNCVGPLTGVSSVAYSILGSGNAPANAADFAGGVLPSGVITFAAGESSKTLVIGIANDSVFEQDENFIVMLSSPVNATLNGYVGLATILNDDAGGPVTPPPVGPTTIALETLGAAGNEAILANLGLDYVVKRTGSLTGVSTVSYAITGSGSAPANGTDFVGGVLPSGTLTFAAGESSKTIHVSVADDATIEQDEHFTVTLSNVAGAVLGNTTADGLIGNDDPRALDHIVLATASAGGLEASIAGTGIDYAVTRTGDLAAGVSVDWSVAGSGVSPVNGADFAGGVLPSGTLTFAAGEISKSIHLGFVNDATVEPDETFVLTLSNPNGAVILPPTTATGTILNDDTGSSQPTTIFLDTLGGSSSEAILQTLGLNYVVLRTGPLTGVSTVNYSVSGSGASPANAADFAGGILPSGTLTFAAGESSKTIHLGFADDANIEPTETFTLSLFNAAGAVLGNTTATGTILDDDTAAPTVAFTAYSVSASEGAGGVDIAVSRSGGVGGASSVAYAVSGEGAAPVSSSDFAAGVLPSGVVLFAPGETTKTIHLSFVNDAVSEQDEGFVVTLSNPNGATLGGASSVHGTIVNDDIPASTISLTTTSVSATEDSGGVDFVVTRTGGLSGVSTVNYAVAGYFYPVADAADFTGGVLPTGTVTFAANESSKTIHIGFANDAQIEQDELFTLTLSNAANAQLGVNSGSGTIINDDPFTPLIGFAVAAGSSYENGVGYDLYVQRTGNLSGVSTVFYSTVGTGSAPTDAADFLVAGIPSGTLTFAPNESSKFIHIVFAGDAQIEPNERFTVTLSNPTGGTLGTATFDGTILNDDFPPAAPQISISYSTSSAAENGAGYDFVIIRTGDVSGVSTIGYDVTGGVSSYQAYATAADFNGGVFPFGTLTFAAGETLKTVHINVLNDDLFEPTEVFNFVLSNPVGAALYWNSASASITNDDRPSTVRFAPQSQSQSGKEGALAVSGLDYVVYRSGDLTHAASADYAVNGYYSSSGPDGSDFKGGALPSGVVNFAPGQSSATIHIDVLDDNVWEKDEGFNLVLSNPKEVTLDGNSAYGTILNDDAIPVLPTITVADFSITEGNNGYSYYYLTVTRDGDVRDTASFSYALASSGASPATASDFTYGGYPTGQATFYAGSSTTSILFSINGDTQYEPDETFTLTLSNAVGVKILTPVVTGTIVNDDANVLPVISLANSQYTVLEADQPLTIDFRVDRSGKPAGASTVAYAVTGWSSASANGADFTAGTMPSGLLSFAAGETSKVISITLAGDTQVEGTEQFALELANPTGAALGGSSEIVTVNDNDVAVARPTLALSWNAFNGKEGSSGETPFIFVVTRSGDAGAAASVDYSVTGVAGSTGFAASASDFHGGALPSGTLSFAAGELIKSFTVNVIGDTDIEQDEGFSVALSNAVGATISSGAITRYIINDDAPPPELSFVQTRIAHGEGASGASTAYNFTVVRLGAITDGSSVAYSVAGSGAAPADAADFQGGVLPSGMLVFGAGEATKTITIMVAGDAAIESDENFTLNLANPVNGTIAGGSALGEVLNDDAIVTPSLPGLGVAIPDTNHLESEGAFNFSIIRIGDDSGAISVSYSVVGMGSSPATAADFTGGVLPTGTVSLAAGEASKIITIGIVNDAVAEQDEAFSVNLSSPVGATISVSSSIGVILNDDAAATIGISQPTSDSLEAAYRNITRTAAAGSAATWVDASLVEPVSDGQLTLAQAVTQIVSKAGATTSVASLAYEFFTGSIPTQAGFDYLVSPTGGNVNNLNSDYYQSFNLENRYINFAMNLGKLGAGAASFLSDYGGLSLFDATRAAYTKIFGGTPTDAKIHALIDTRADYFAAYGLDGPNGIGTKAAMVGWLLAEAVKADVGMYAKANDAFLIDLADGAQYGVDLVGVYGKAEYIYAG